MISPPNLLKTMAPTQDMIITTSQKNFLRGENFSRPAKIEKGSSFFGNYRFPNYLNYLKGSPMKYHPLRLVSWVNSTQCSFKLCILQKPPKVISQAQQCEQPSVGDQNDGDEGNMRPKRTLPGSDSVVAS